MGIIIILQQQHYLQVEEIVCLSATERGLPE